ncbi:hypothetical protein OWR29_39820 [Actinoplanes sp. Pm04-4]|uniref:Right handed beta helix domain-containing protein n=1 Tax=Paractinoplanes pyxinae TaxID=2997416 RepID=A0ABT4BF30_9ACTN|nr:hypothetical protein [Actinoplanes pyxinae]MCY1144178.1 hypothetical protein [Actinoplanes pyxinae]
MIDNDELPGWSHAAVSPRDTAEGRVRGNHLHHNRQTGLDYGIELERDTSAVIEDNRFEHAIAATGIRTQQYDARLNTVSSNPARHSFDMHGEHEALANNQPYAGAVIHIDHNASGDTTQKAVVIRGQPATVATVTGKLLRPRHPGSLGRAKSALSGRTAGQLVVSANTYSTAPANCSPGSRHVSW